MSKKANTTCACGNKFYRRPSYVILGRMKNCSRECGYKVVSQKLKGSNNGQWKENVKYDALHDWIRRNKSSVELCENCNKVAPYDLANISGEYKRDINDFKWLCRKCHMVEDGRINNLKQFSKV